MPPVAPMLARLERELPRDGYLYEPKWDGFRCLAFPDGEAVDLRSRNQRPLARYFPELVRALRKLPLERFALDGEIVVEGPRRGPVRAGAYAPTGASDPVAASAASCA